MSAHCWAILTGEFPPQPGGVSDYTCLVAEELARRGDEVHVWAPAFADGADAKLRAQVHRLPDHFGRRGLAELKANLSRLRQPYRLLVQYVPHAFGYKGMNLGFCQWIRRQRNAPVWVMFHEVAFPLSWYQPLEHNVLGMMNRVMARLIARSAERLFMSIPAWEQLLRRLAGSRPCIEWLPVPSTVPTQVDPLHVAASRTELSRSPDGLLIGHFGTFGPAIARSLGSLLPALLMKDKRRAALLIGRGGARFAEVLARENPSLAGRLHATGELPAETIAIKLACCDLLVQPYPDGISTRRTTAMAALALGLPIVTTEGPLTEPLWREANAVKLAVAGYSAILANVAEELLKDKQARAQLGINGKKLYRATFSLEHTVNALQDKAQNTRCRFRQSTPRLAS